MLRNIDIAYTGIAETLAEVAGVFERIYPAEENLVREKLTEEVATQTEILVGHILHFQYAQATEGLRKLNTTFAGTSGLPVEIMRNHCSYILMGLNSAMNKDPMLDSHFRNIYSQLKKELWRCYFPRDISHWVDRLCAHMEQMEQTRAPAASLADRAASYIQAHYAEDLSLDIIAGYIKVSPTYLSRIFAQEKGKGSPAVPFCRRTGTA